MTLVERTRRVVRFTPLGDRIADKARTRAARGGGAGRSGARRRAAAVGRDADERDPDDRALHAAAHPAAAAARLSRPEAVPARGAERGGVRGAAPWPHRLRAARPALCLRRCRDRSPCSRTGCSSPARQARSATIAGSIRADDIDETRLLLLEDGHCLKDHALAACNRPELRAEATMMGTSLHTIVQMVDNGLGVTMLPEMAIEGGHPRPHRRRPRVRSTPQIRHAGSRWSGASASPREKDFRLLAEVLGRWRGNRERNHPAGLTVSADARSRRVEIDRTAGEELDEPLPPGCTWFPWPNRLLGAGRLLHHVRRRRAASAIARRRRHPRSAAHQSGGRRRGDGCRPRRSARTPSAAPISRRSLPPSRRPVWSRPCRDRPVHRVRADQRAFGRLAPGTVDTLMKPENKATLAKVLTYHVVPGNMSRSTDHGSDQAPAAAPPR